MLAPFPHGNNPHASWFVRLTSPLIFKHHSQALDLVSYACNTTWKDKTQHVPMVHSQFSPQMHVGSCMTLSIIYSLVNAIKFGPQWNMAMKHLLTNNQKHTHTHIKRPRESFYMGSRLHYLVSPWAHSDTKQQSMRWHLTKPMEVCALTILRVYASWHDWYEPKGGTLV